MDENTISWMDYVLLAGCIAYFVCPTDMIPDCIPGVGYSDDLAALTMGFKQSYKIFSQTAKDAAVNKAAEIFGNKFDAEQAAKIVLGVIENQKKK